MRESVKIKGFTEEEIKTIQSAVYAVWEYVGFDCLAAVAEEKGKTADQVTMSRRDVIEISLDAGRPEEELRKMGASDDLIKRFDALDYETMKKLVRPAFPYGRYGT